MIESLTNDDVFEALDPKEVESGCRFILEAKYPGGKDARASALRFAAELKRFRPEYLARRPAEKNIPLLVQATRHSGAQRLRPDVVKAWLVGNYRPLLSAFLEACNIPEKDGFVEGNDPPPPEKETLRHAMDKIAGSFEERVVAIYLAFLLINGGDFWVNLAAAVTPGDTSAVSESVGSGGAESGAASAPLAEEAESVNAEDSTAFTTLDRVLIERAVAAANEDTGALSEDQLEDFIEEIVALNSSRQHSVFHRGFFHALFGRPMEFSFRGENASRRIWYFTGALMGLLRGANKDRVLEILREEQELFGLLCDKGSPVAANMLLPQLIPALWDEGELTMAKKLAESHLDGLQPKAFVDLVVQLYYKCAALLRKGQWEQAGWFLEFIGDAVPKRADLPEGFHEWFRPHVDRKLAQVFQLKGDFQSAAHLLQHVAADEEGREQGSALADLGLIRGKLRSLQSSLPSKEERHVAAVMSALATGRDDFQAACDKYPKDATNAHFCLGLLDLLHEKRVSSAADHFREALSGMLGKQDAYSEGGMLAWNRFLLGLSRLESGEPAEFEHARALLQGALSDEINYPLWLWNRAMQAAAPFPDTSLGETIARHLLEHRGAEAYRSIWDSGLAADIAALRGPYVEWMSSAPLPISDKWKQLKQLLPAALKGADYEQGENILDQMERLAEQAPDVRSEFVELLREHRNFSPAWEPADAAHALSKLYELDNNAAQGLGLLYEEFFRLRNEDNPSFETVGPQFVDRMVELGADEDTIANLRRNLPAQETPAAPPSELEQLVTVSVSVVYIGGNETQAGYEDKLREKLSKSFPGLRLKTIFPGWGSNWIVYLDQVRGLLPHTDVVVLSHLVRTQFGRAVRKHCNNDVPWWPCTGRGLKALKSSIETAALWAASKKNAA